MSEFWILIVKLIKHLFNQAIKRYKNSKTAGHKNLNSRISKFRSLRIPPSISIIETFILTIFIIYRVLNIRVLNFISYFVIEYYYPTICDPVTFY